MISRLAIGLTILALQSVSGAHAEGLPFICQCRGPVGQLLDLGAKICLRAPDGTNRMAVCVMEQNVTSWRPTNEPCVTSQLGTVTRARGSAAFSPALFRGL